VSGRACCWAVLLGHAGECGRDRAGARAGRSAGPDQRERKESARVRFCFSF
jgi:hypothetical protein